MSSYHVFDMWSKQYLNLTKCGAVGNRNLIGNVGYPQYITVNYYNAIFLKIVTTRMAS